MRVFKHDEVAKWASGQGITDQTLLQAATEVVTGNFDADLYNFLFKKRIARGGAGSRKGFRTIICYKQPNEDRVAFLYGFAKNEASDLSKYGKNMLTIRARLIVNATDTEMAALLKSGTYIEVK